VIAHQQEENTVKTVEKKKKDAIIDALGKKVAGIIALRASRS
jgi:hypothetical protein